MADRRNKKLYNDLDIKEILEKCLFPKDLKCHTSYTRQHDDTDGEADGNLTVRIDSMGDVYIRIDNGKVLRFRNFGGGGNSLKTRNALVLLAEAMRLDNLSNPMTSPKLKYITHNPKCEKCGGAGWVWWNELDEYDGPANDPHNCQSDDTRYSCDACKKRFWIDVNRYPYGKISKTLRKAVDWINDNGETLKSMKEQDACLVFDFPDFWNMPKRISSRLNSDEVDFIQGNT